LSAMPLATSLETIRRRFHRLTQELDAHPAYKRFSTVPTNDGGPHAELNAGVLAYVVTERGKELERRETDNPDELLYWLVSDVAGDAARRYELNHRKSGVDSRRLWFEKHVELLSALNPAWGHRKQTEYDEVLKRNPYRDRA
jgi:hypothetical protein